MSTTSNHSDMLELFADCVAREGDRPAILYFDTAISYAELGQASDRLSRWLSDAGVGKGDRVAILLQNIPQFVMMSVAAWKVGAIPVPVNPVYRSAEMGRIFADADPVAFLCADTDVIEVRKAIAAAGCRADAVMVTSPGSFQSRNDARVLPAPIGVSTGDCRLEETLKRAGTPRAEIELGGADIGLILYTSGTTGVPKGAMIRHAGLAFNAAALKDWCKLGPESRILGLAPLFHITGFVCHMAAAFSARATLVLHYRVEPSLVLDIIREHRPTFAIGAITAFNALASVPGLTHADMASFDRIYSGGAPIPPALRDSIQQCFGRGVYPSYGMTETAAPTHMAPFGRDIPVDPISGALAVGMTMRSTDAMIVDDSGRPAPLGATGELAVRGPQIMAGYWRKPQETAEALRDGWLRTGDVAFADADGWYYLVDRKKDVIIASGFKVWPREVEDVLYAHPAVREAAIVGAPDPYRGETVKGFVSLKEGRHADPAELIEHCRRQLAGYKVPRSMEILSELPKTATGKIQRVALR